MRKINLILVIAMLLTMLVSCGISESGTTNDAGNGGENNPNASNGESAEKYDIESIGAFYNGYARFSVSVEDEDGWKNKYGYLNSKGQVAIAPEYEEAPEIFTDLTYVTKDGESYFINAKNERITYEAPAGSVVKIGEYSNGYFWVQTRESTIAGDIDTMTYFDMTGKKAFSVENASELLYATAEQGFAFYNGSEDVIYSSSSFDKNGHAVVGIKEDDSPIPRGMLIDTTGKAVELTEDKSVLSVHGNYIITYESGTAYVYYVDFVKKTMDEVGSFKLYFVNSTYFSYGKNLNIEIHDNSYLAFWRIENYARSFAGVQYNGSLILNLAELDSLSGAYVRDISYAQHDGQGYIALYLESKDGAFFSSIIDIKGNVTVSPTQKYSIGEQVYSQYLWSFTYKDYETYPISDGLIMAKDTATGLFGYVNLKGEWAIQPQYTSATTFSNGVAVVDDNTIIDKKGEVVFNAE